jgi:hypothetical protein
MSVIPITPRHATLCGCDGGMGTGKDVELIELSSRLHHIDGIYVAAQRN